MLNKFYDKYYQVYFKTDLASSQEDLYCITDLSLIEKLEEYQKNKKQVTIKYYAMLFSKFTECGYNMNSDIINNVEIEE